VDEVLSSLLPLPTPEVLVPLALQYSYSGFPPNSACCCSGQEARLTSISSSLTGRARIGHGGWVVWSLPKWRTAIRSFTLLAADGLAIWAAGALFLWLTHGLSLPLGPMSELDVRSLGFDLAVPSIAIVVYLAIRGRYCDRTPFWNEARLVASTCLYAIAAEAIFGALTGDARQLAPVFAVLLLVPAFCAIANRLAKEFLSRAGFWALPTVVVGDSLGVAQAEAALMADRSLGYQIVGRVPPPAAMSNSGEPPLQSVLSRHRASHLVIAIDDNHLQRRVIEAALRERVEFAIVPSVQALPAFACSATRFFGCDAMLLSYWNGLSRPRFRVVKTGIDVAIAALVLLITSPILLAIAVAIRMDGGPALFAHRRVGTGGRHFKCLKFRTMVSDADQVLGDALAADPDLAAEWAATRKLRNDPRITWLGKFLRQTSLDELPQLINVIRLEMSLVGPRPIVDNEIAFYGEDISHYYAARPGLTGLWQVSGRSNTSYARRVQLDTWYVTNWTIWNDITVLLKTIPAVLRRDGAR
jgi:Undecaprenyl-phosphate galactose phosphotransferase WbaP